MWVREHGRERPLRDSMRELWIDPRSGILRNNRRRVTPRQARRARREQAVGELCARMVPGKDNVQYHWLGDGAWWEVTLACEADLPSPDAIPPTDVVLAAGLSALPTSELYGREGVCAVEKRQMSRREVARLRQTGDGRTTKLLIRRQARTWLKSDPRGFSQIA